MNTPERKDLWITVRDSVQSFRYWRALAGVVLGGIAGYLYYHFIGCASGTCAITSNPFMSVIFGATIGYYLMNRSCSSC